MKRTLTLHRRSIFLILLLVFSGLRETESWIALSKDGYLVTRGLNIECVPLMRLPLLFHRLLMFKPTAHVPLMIAGRNGSLIEGDMLVNGPLNSFFNHTDVKVKIQEAQASKMKTKDREELENRLTGCDADREGGMRSVHYCTEK